MTNTQTRIAPAPSRIEFQGLSRATRARIEEATAKLTDSGRTGPGWVVSELPGGATNLNFRIETETGRSYVLRVAGPDRPSMGGTIEAGWEVQSAAAAGGIGAPVIAYCAPDGHCLAEFIPGDPLTPELLRRRRLFPEVASLLRRLHELPPVPAEWSAVGDIARYEAMAREDGSDLPVDYPDLLAAVLRIEDVFQSVESALGFCHNDLQIQNFIDDGKRLWLVDWEWAGMGNRYFDIGGLLVNAEATVREAEDFVRAYFGGDVDTEVELARCHIMQVVSAVREAMWAVAAQTVLEAEWDYPAWASDYFDRARTLVGEGRFEAMLAMSRGRARA